MGLEVAIKFFDDTPVVEDVVSVAVADVVADDDADVVAEITGLMTAKESAGWTADSLAEVELIVLLLTMALATLELVL